MTTSRSDIPEEAVEAAMRASYRPDGWEDENTIAFMRRALEAAAPIIRAQALREAADSIREPSGRVLAASVVVSALRGRAARIESAT